MSDYLSNLVTRTLHPEHCVQPRLASVFESSHAVTTTEGRPQAKPDVFSTAVDEESREFLGQPAASVKEVRKRDNPAHHAFNLHRTSTEKREHYRQRDHSEVAQNISPLAQDSKQTNEVEVGLGTTIGHDETLELIPRTIFETLQPQIASTPLPLTKIPKLVRVSMLTPTLNLTEVSEAKPGPVGDVPITYPPVQRVPFTPVTPAQKSRSHESGADPTVNVTIGRVEIRAASPIERPRTKPAGTAVMNLEEYLRQRSQGVSR